MKNILNLRKDFEIYGSRAGRVEFIDKEDLLNKSILDLGCGYGWLLKYALDNGATEAVGIEISERDLQTARESINDPKLTLAIGDSSKIPYGDNYFDTVCAWEIIEHIPTNTESNMFAEVARVLKPGGHFYLSTPYRSFIAMVFDPAWWLTNHRHYSQDQLKKFAEDNNFRIIKVALKGNFYSLLLSLSMYFSKWVLHRKPIFENILRNKSTNEYRYKTGYLTIIGKYAK